MKEGINRGRSRDMNINRGSDINIKRDSGENINRDSEIENESSLLDDTHDTILNKTEKERETGTKMTTEDEDDKS